MEGVYWNRQEKETDFFDDLSFKNHDFGQIKPKIETSFFAEVFRTIDGTYTDSGRKCYLFFLLFPAYARDETRRNSSIADYIHFHFPHARDETV